MDSGSIPDNSTIIQGLQMRYFLIFLIFFTTLFAQIDSVSFEDEFSDKKQERSWDPLEPYNISMTKINDFVYINLLGPTAKGYRYIVPQPARTSVTNFFTNLLFPVRFVNNILQLKFHNASEELARFLINSTVGIAGLFDPATSQAKLVAHNEDFGQTLGFYGASNDLHIVLPLLGPSNLRDVFGLVGDSFLDPLNIAYDQDTVFNNDGEYIALRGLDIINEYSLRADDYENLSKNSLNLYPLLKSIYEQRRIKQIEE